MRQPNGSIAALIFATAALVSGCGRAPAGRPAAAPVQNSALPPLPAPAVSRTEIANAAADALRQINEAREAISAKLQAAALDHTEEALWALNRLHGRTVAPIYAEMDEVSLLGPVTRAKSASSPTTPAETVQTVSGVFTRVALNVDAARRQVEAARRSLVQSDFQVADADLAAAQGAVDLEQISTNVPLLRARENLTLAKEAAAGRRTTELKADLRAAARALTAFGTGGGRHSADAIQLSHDLSTYDGSNPTDRNAEVTRINTLIFPRKSGRG